MDHNRSATGDIIDAEEERRLAVALGGELRGIRGKRRLTQDQLAELTGIGKRTLVRIEVGDAPVRLEQIYRLCKALGVLPSTVIDAAEKEINIGQ